MGPPKAERLQGAGDRGPEGKDWPEREPPSWGFAAELPPCL